MARKDELPHDLQITPEQKSKIDHLSEADIKDIDGNILDNVSHEWSKVSRIVLTTMIERDEGVTGLPELFYLERVVSLVKEGRLEARGDLGDMRSSEVRLAEKK